nr:MAG TPA: hypothetical protein [Caudoviricetes sp.]
MSYFCFSLFFGFWYSRSRLLCYSQSNYTLFFAHCQVIFCLQSPFTLRIAKVKIIKKGECR